MSLDLLSISVSAAANSKTRATFAPLQSVITRPPAANDDATAGYAVNDQWIHNGLCYVCQRATAGAAVWQRQRGSLSLAGDAVSGLQAAYAMRRVVSAYAGSCINVVRASDSSALDIGFLASGALDVATLMRFLNGTTGVIATWYDQSGNGYHATATGTARPVISPERFFGDNLGVLFDNPITINGSSKIKQALTIPSGLALTSNNLSVVSLAAFGHSTRNSPIVELSGATALCFGNSDASGVAKLAMNYSSFRGLNNYRPPILGRVHGLTVSSSHVILYARDTITFDNSTTTAGTSLTGGLIGGTTKFVDGTADPDYGYNAQGALLVYNRPLTAAEWATVSMALNTHFGMRPQVRSAEIFDGDSIVEGAYGTYFNSWPRRLGDFLATPRNLYNAARAGGTFATQIAAVAKWAILYDPAVQQRATIVVGCNDLAANGGTAGYNLTMIANLAAYLAAVRAAGWLAPVRVGTILQRGDLTGQKETERLAYNAYVRANWAAMGFSALLDFANEPTLSAAGATSNTTYFGNLVHPSELGLAFLAQTAAAIIEA